MQVLIFFEGTKYSSYQWCLKTYKDTETEARIIGVQTQMNIFNYFLLWHSNNFSATLQSPLKCAKSIIKLC